MLNRLFISLLSVLYKLKSILNDFNYANSGNTLVPSILRFRITPLI